MSKNIGQVKNRVLVKSGKQVVLFRAVDGFGVPQKLLESGVIDGVEVTYEGKQYGALVATFLDKGIRYQKPPYEPQIILPRKYWASREANTAKAQRA